MVSNKCVVIGCVNSAKRKYVFPTNNDDLAIWIARTGNVNLQNLSKDHIRKSFQICRNHFHPDCDSPGTNLKLKYRSLPTLYLPGKILYYFITVYVFYFIT